MASGDRGINGRQAAALLGGIVRSYARARRMGAVYIKSGGDILSASNNTGGHGRGPDLLDKAAAAADGNRILSQLEHGVTPAAPPARRWHPGRRHLRGGLLCLLLATGALLLLREHAALPEPAAAPPAKPATAGMAPPAAPAPVPPARPDATAATIVNEAGPAMPLAPGPADAAPAQAVPAPQRRAATRAPAPKPAVAPAGDGDVALLTAMVAHAHRQEGAASRTDAARDVVLRKTEEETASLLQRCRQLGLIEGMLCRSRICSDRWDSDPACH